MAKEKARRKQAIIGRQEEELAARESTLDSMQKEQASSSRQREHLQEDNKALKVYHLNLAGIGLAVIKRKLCKAAASCTSSRFLLPG